MSVSIIDGTLETLRLRRKTRRQAVFDVLVFRRKDGGEEQVTKAVVTGKMAETLVPGVRGRFYLYRSIDQKGLHGLRLTNGKAIFDYPIVNERLMLMVLIVNCVLLVGRLALEGMIWILPLLLIVFSVIVYPLYRRTHLEARDQFDADAAYAAPH